jgi:protein-disulfide isomerase
MSRQGVPAPARNRRILIWVSTILGVVVVGLLIHVMATVITTRAAPADTTPQVLRSESHRLGIPAEDGAVTLVEFLDFECEVCGAAYPLIEELRAEYEGEVTFVVRYFPIPAHKNSGNAALAAEAAARQGRFEEMYLMLFETQRQWGEQQDSKAALFREYAVELGLDLDQYDADIADPATKQRVAADFDEGMALGVSGTPTFFLNGEKLELVYEQDLADAIEEALAR